jgi:hypothetical protein
MQKHRLVICIFVTILVLSVGCTSTPTREPFYTRIYSGAYDEVWLATLKALNDYPLKMSNKDTGRIESEIINGPYNDLLFSPAEPIELPERFRYSIKINFAKLQASNDRSLTRVRIVKNLEKFRDFYAGWNAFASDGLEESLILYRIQHILQMDQRLAEEE